MGRGLAIAARPFTPVVLVGRSPDLRRSQLALLSFGVAEWATWIAMLIYAFRIGGAVATGVVALVQLTPAALVAPFASSLGDRFRRQDVMVVTYVAGSSMMAATAVALFAHAALPLIYGLAAAVATSITLSRPTHAALVATVARSPEELIAANVTTGMIQSASVLVGPVIAGVLLAKWSPGAVFAVMSVFVMSSALLVAGVHGPEGLVTRKTTGARETARHALGGFRSLASKPAPRLVVGLLSLQSVVWGALDVLLVVLAIDLLRMGQAGVGFLNSALGAGGIMGSLGTFALVGRRRLSPAFMIGVLLWGATIAAIAFFDQRAAAFALIVLAGCGRTLIDVSGRTLLQRIVPNHLLARVFGVLEGLYMGTLAVGSIAAPGLIAWLGVRGAFVAAGLILPVVTLASLQRLRRIDSNAVVPERELNLVRRVPLFAPMPAQMIEPLAVNLVPVPAAEGEFVIRQGEIGDRFYIVRDGKAEVRVADKVLAVYGPGDSFGEIALLRDVRRTADVVAVSNLSLYALDRETFVEAVTGHLGSIAAADTVIEDRLDR